MEDRHTVRAPRSIMGGQYSLPFTTAVALTRDLSNPLVYDEAVLSDAVVLDLAQHIELITFDAEAGQATTAEVILELDGQTYTLPTSPPKGSPRNPFTWDDVCEKFSRYAGQVIEKERLPAIIDAVKDLETISDMADLAKAISA
jgi:2-methylcitrate dehydratase PrpD